MTLSIRLNGVDFEGFTEAEVVRDLETAASTFSFSTTSSNQQFIPIREGDAVEITADENFKILTGFVDGYGINYDSERHTIIVNGRSKTEDLIDSTVGALKEFDEINLVRLCEIVSKDFGILVINKAGNIKNFTDFSSAETGQLAFDFLESFARKRQVLLTDDENGNLVLTRASTVLSPNSLVNLLNSEINNIKRGSRRVNIANLFNEYIAQSQQNPFNASEFETAEELSDQVGITKDNEIRDTRRFEFYAEETTESLTLKDRAKWEMSLRRARAFNYNCTVQGHSINNTVWIPNLLHQIDDDFAQLHGQFLCNKVTYRYSLPPNGSETDLNFTLKNAYTLESDKDKLILS